jgi:hypothetical protein
LNNITAVAQQQALSAVASAQRTLEKLNAWAENKRADPERERGGYSTEMTVVIAAIVLLAIAVVAIIAKKVLDKASSISM